MALGEAFCIVCGKGGELTSGRLCETCFRERTTLSSLTETMQLFRCPKCMMVLQAGRWGRLEPEELHHGMVQTNLEVDKRAEALGVAMHSETVDERNTKLTIQVSGYIDGLEFGDEHDTIVRVSDAVCPTCTRKAGNYYEATVQLRSSGRRLSEDELAVVRATLDELLESMEPDPMFFITSESAVTGGWDIVMGSKSLSRSWGRFLIKRFGGSTKETNTVVGYKDGQDITRLTLLYRKPAFDIGDVIRLRNADWLVAKWQKDGAILASITRRERTGVTWRDLEKSNVLSRTVDQLDVEIINRDSSAAEFLDPRDWKVRAVGLPFDDDGTSETLRVALLADEWVALPNLSRTDGGD